MKLIFATHNSGKIKEMRQILAGIDIEIVSAEDVGIYEDIIEDELTFEDNALKKARYVSEKTGEWAFADDSGICIEALKSAPGIFSARWAGKEATGESVINHTLMMMKYVPDGRRGAWMETAAALVSPVGKAWIFTGKIAGTITEEPRGELREKLPYDSIFIPEGYDQTFAELSQEEKNAMSHRGQAFEALKAFIKENIAV